MILKISKKFMFSSRIIYAVAVIWIGFTIGIPDMDTLFSNLYSYWRHGGVILQDKWNHLVDTFGEKQEPYWIYGTTLIIFIVFWVVGGIYTLMDVTGKPSFMQRDITPDKEALTTSRILKVIKQALINMIFVDLIIRMIAVPILMLRGVEPLRELPSVITIVVQCLFMFIAYDFSIYYTHRMLHNKLLYKIAHKRHHEWTVPIALTAFYCHPLEHILSNTLPPSLGVLILGPHVVTTWIWAIYVVLLGISSHSTFRLFHFPNPAYHDMHHKQFTVNYGVLGLLDIIHGTYRSLNHSSQLK